MKLRTYWDMLERHERLTFAAQSGTTFKYIARHLISEPPSREPSPKLLRQMAVASNGFLTRLDLFEQFYNVDDVTDDIPQTRRA